MYRRILTLFSAVMLATACADEFTSPPLSAVDARAAVGAQQLGFMSRNLYIGTDLDAVVGALANANPGDDLPALLGAIGDLQATAWPARAEALADEIAREQPQVIGLQEVWKVDIVLPPFAVQINQDFLASIETALAARGLPYAVAVVGAAVSANPFPGISVLDRDVVLVDTTRVQLTPGTAVAQLFAANIGVVAPGVNVRRGWVAVDAEVDGVPMRLVNTHLESGQSPQLSGLRALQAQQLVAAIGAAPRVVLLGDFNDVPGSPMYGVVAAAGFADAWAELRPEQAGYTCCHAELLGNATTDEAFTQRIDYVFSRGLQHKNGELLGQVRLTGVLPNAQLAGPLGSLWPSDHAGVAARLLLTPSSR